MPAPASEDDLKRRARRRLIGAVALTLAAVIVLPLLLEDEPPPAGRLEVRMPPVAALPKRVDDTPAPPVVPLDEEPDVPPAPEAVASVEPDPKPKPLVEPEPELHTRPNASPKTESKLFPPHEATSPAYVVQLGAFSDTAKVAALKANVEKLGLPTYTDKSGALTRLRVGPFTSRETAIEAAMKLRGAGVDGKVMPK